MPNVSKPAVEEDNLVSGSFATRLEPLAIRRSSVERAHLGLLAREAHINSFGRRSLFQHLDTVATMLEEWSQPIDVVLAGLFYNVYVRRSEQPPLFEEDERDLVIELIGEEAEALVYAYRFANRQAKSTEVDRLGLVDFHNPDLSDDQLNALRIIKAAVFVEQECSDDRGPGCWLTDVSILADLIPDTYGFKPRILSACKSKITREEERRLISSYNALLENSVTAAQNDLDTICAALPHIGEPFIISALTSFYRGAIADARSFATTGKTLIRSWNEPWDKRISGLAWITIAESIEAWCDFPCKNIVFIHDRLESLVNLRPQELHATLTYLGLLGQMDGTSLPCTTQDTISLSPSPIPPRFIQYIETINVNTRLGRFPRPDMQEYFEASKFEIARDLEANSGGILMEYHALSPQDFHDEAESIERFGKWKIKMLAQRGVLNTENLASLPTLERVLQKHENALSAYGTVYISRLLPNTNIAPHSGPNNIRLRCHLGLVIPNDCGMIVNGKPQRWIQGKCTIFDDSFEHSVWNRSSEMRAVVIVDIWHPDLSESEIGYLRGLQRFAHLQSIRFDKFMAKNDRARQAEIDEIY